MKLSHQDKVYNSSAYAYNDKITQTLRPLAFIVLEENWNNEEGFICWFIITIRPEIQIPASAREIIGEG